MLSAFAGREWAKFLKFLWVRSGFKLLRVRGGTGQDFPKACGCVAGADKIFQPAQDSSGYTRMKTAGFAKCMELIS